MGFAMLWLRMKLADFCHRRARRALARMGEDYDRARRWLQLERKLINRENEHGTTQSTQRRGR